MKIKLFKPVSIYEIGQRENQEDSISPAHNTATLEDTIFIVCDGMGGHSKGEVASSIVCDEMNRYLHSCYNEEIVLSDTVFEKALDHTYTVLDEQDDGAEAKMGTTLTCLCIHKGGVFAAHVGDSRIYHFRPATGEILYKSKDHSLVFDMFMAGAISKEEMATSPLKNQITRAILPGKESRVNADYVHITDVKPGDVFLMCTDGLLETITDEELIDIVESCNSGEQIRDKLISRSEDHSDNHSAYILRVNSVTAEANDEWLPDDEQTAISNALIYERNNNTTQVVATDMQYQERQEESENQPGYEEVVYPRHTAGKPTGKPVKKHSRLSRIFIFALVALALMLVVFYAAGLNNDKGQRGKQSEDFINNGYVDEHDLLNKPRQKDKGNAEMEEQTRKAYEQEQTLKKNAELFKAKKEKEQAKKKVSTGSSGVSAKQPTGSVKVNNPETAPAPNTTGGTTVQQNDTRGAVPSDKPDKPRKEKDKQQNKSATPQVKGVAEPDR